MIYSPLGRQRQGIQGLTCTSIVLSNNRANIVWIGTNRIITMFLRFPHLGARMILNLHLRYSSLYIPSLIAQLSLFKKNPFL